MAAAECSGESPRGTTQSTAHEQEAAQLRGAGEGGAAVEPPAAAPPQAAPTVQHCWRPAFDANSQRWYFYNAATGQTQWEPPPGWLPPPAAAPRLPLLHPAHAAAIAAAAGAAAGHHRAAAAAAAAAAASQARPGSTSRGGTAGPAEEDAASGAAASGDPSAATQQHSQLAGASPPAAPGAAPGYYYRGAYGAWQGPFSKEQLAGWRGALPMDLPVQCRGAQQQPPAAATVGGGGGGPGCCLELAKVLGDGELLARWRGDNPGKAAVPGSAPSAEAFERELAAGGGYSAYAAAALAGLPADDDAVQVARLAASSGRSIQDLLSFNYGSGGVGDYTATALHSRGRGRVQAADAQAEDLYGEMGSWVDSRTVEEQLARAAEARRKGVSGKELAALKARKQEMKRKKAMEWLTR